MKILGWFEDVRDWYRDESLICQQNKILIWRIFNSVLLILTILLLIKELYNG